MQVGQELADGPSPRARGRHLLTWEFTRSMGSSHSVWRRGRRGAHSWLFDRSGITASGCGLLPSRIYQVYGTSYRRSPLRTARRIGGVGSSYWCSAAWASVIMSLGGGSGSRSGWCQASGRQSCLVCSVSVSGSGGGGKTATGESYIDTGLVLGVCFVGSGESVDGAPVVVVGVGEAVVDAVSAESVLHHPRLSVGVGDGFGAAEGASAGIC